MGGTLRLIFCAGQTVASPCSRPQPLRLQNGPGDVFLMRGNRVTVTCMYMQYPLVPEHCLGTAGTILKSKRPSQQFLRILIKEVRNPVLLQLTEHAVDESLVRDG